MKSESSEIARVRILALIDSEYESDAAFERALGLSEKTVNNWRRGRSASFMKMLPRLAGVFHVHVTDILDVGIDRESGELSEEELALIRLYRKTRTLPKEKRQSLQNTIEQVITLYLTGEEKEGRRKKRGTAPRAEKEKTK